MDTVIDRSENKERRYLLSLMLLFLLTLKALWFADDVIMNAHPGSMIFVFFDLLFRLTFF
jgi:hypothetical protein